MFFEADICIYEQNKYRLKKIVFKILKIFMFNGIEPP